MNKNITIHVDDLPIEVVLKSARKADGLRRADLMVKALQSGNDLKSQVAFYLYPTCVSCVTSPDSVKDMTLEDFIERVDEEDIDLWTAAAYELNPQWRKSFEALSQFGAEVDKAIKAKDALLETETQTEVPQI